MLLRWKSFLHTDGGWGDVNMHCIASSEDYVEYVVTLNFQKNAIPNGKSKHYVYDISWWTWKRQNNIETADNISQICCPHAELIPDILTL